MLLCVSLLCVSGCAPAAIPGETDGLFDLFRQYGVVPSDEGNNDIPVIVPIARNVAFSECMREVMLNAITQGDRLSAMQLDQILQNIQEVDTTRSSKTNMSVQLSYEEDTIAVSQELTL